MIKMLLQIVDLFVESPACLWDQAFLLLVLESRQLQSMNRETKHVLFEYYFSVKEAIAAFQS